MDMDKFVLSHGAAEIVLSDEYPGVTIKSQDLLRIRAEAKSATAFCRYLLGHFFSIDELAVTNRATLQTTHGATINAIYGNNN